MKLILVDDNEDRINLRKSKTNLIETLKGSDISEDELFLIKDKMISISKNMDVIKAVAKGLARTSKAIDSNGKPLKYKEQRAVKELDKVGIIELDTSWAMDEFLFRYADDSILPNSCNSIEVVTPEIAESNDMDWITGTPEISLEERKTYKLGEVLSDYSKLDDKYYFRFM